MSHRGRGRSARGSGAGGRHQPRQTSLHNIAENGEINAHLSERFRNSPRRENNQDTSKGPTVKVNPWVRQYFMNQQRAREDAERKDPESWQAKQEIPTDKELFYEDSSSVPVPANKIHAPAKSIDKYLKVHYALLREDAVAPLRDAIDAFRRDPDSDDNRNFSVYEKVYIQGFTFANGGIAARISFSTIRSRRRILWSSSKRLISGTLVGLTPAKEGFCTKWVSGLIAARPLLGLESNPPQIDIYFSRPEDLQIDPQQEWVMVEARQGFFEASRYTLQALQRLSQEHFPLSEHICFLDNDLGAPEYLEAQPRRDLSAAVVPEQKSAYSGQDLILDWPPAPQETLDETQWDALRQMLTKRIAVIQGPPGTGKTHVSKIALKILFENRSAHDPPIIVAAQTNHALDQLLAHVYEFDPQLIRLGGQSKHPKIKPRSLFEIRNGEHLQLPAGSGFSRALRDQHERAKRLRESLTALTVESPKSMMSVEALHKLGVLSTEQRTSLENHAKKWIVADSSSQDPMEAWVGSSLMPFKVTYRPNNFVYDDDEDEDLEFEQLREFELDSGIIDEEDAETLRGEWCSIGDHFTAHIRNVRDLDQAKRLLDTTNDLEKVSPNQRAAVYYVMQQRAKHATLIKFRAEAQAYARIIRDVQIGRFERDAVYLQRAKVIGMTTTGLSKYRALISSIRPKIILIEEAAEVFEAPIAVACMESVEHLILVGDHKQLQPHCNVGQLEGEPYNLNISLFERLVDNGIPFKTLLRQRRMMPEFRRLVGSLYPGLQDHVSVTERIPKHYGMGNIRSFFVHHTWAEDRDSSQSFCNPEEALFIARFYHYLVQNGLDSERITVLTFYNGQRKRILKHLREFHDLRESYHNVKTVDSYQGEENDVVILSLVRNNRYGGIGFVDNSNRVCVALSRAKYGFYILGNADLVSKSNELWNDVVTTMKKANRLADRLPVKCQLHGTTTEIFIADHWYNIDGGCMRACGQMMQCGHKCPRKCHVYAHQPNFCTLACDKILFCKHQCTEGCGFPCRCQCPTFAAETRRLQESQEWAVATALPVRTVHEPPTNPIPNNTATATTASSPAP